MKMRHRSMFVVIGDKFHDRVDNLHNFLCNELKKPDPSVLWCYNDTLIDRSHKKKRLRQGKKMMSTKDLTYCKYKDSERVIGITFWMCVLQDFEVLTPNLLARTTETAEGGGLIILALHSIL